MILLGKIGLALVGTAVAGAGILCSEGMVEVKVVERQPESHHVYVIAPAMLMPIGAHFAPKEQMVQASAQVRPWLPTIRAALGGLRDCDDFTLVEMEQPGQHVRVAKTGGAIVVDVDEADETVHISAPLRALSSTVEEIAEAAPAAKP
jgi:hypothetical protein